MLTDKQGLIPILNTQIRLDCSLQCVAEFWEHKRDSWLQLTVSIRLNTSQKTSQFAMLRGWQLDRQISVRESSSRHAYAFTFSMRLKALSWEAMWFLHLCNWPSN